MSYRLSNAQVSLTATPDDGCHVKGWTGADDDASTETANTVTMTADNDVTWEFEKSGGSCVCGPAGPLLLATLLAVPELSVGRR
jgi:hypothetical protein